MVGMEGLFVVGPGRDGGVEVAYPYPCDEPPVRISQRNGQQLLRVALYQHFFGDLMDISCFSLQIFMTLIVDRSITSRETISTVISTSRPSALPGILPSGMPTALRRYRRHHHQHAIFHGEAFSPSLGNPSLALYPSTAPPAIIILPASTAFSCSQAISMEKPRARRGTVTM